MPKRLRKGIDSAIVGQRNQPITNHNAEGSENKANDPSPISLLFALVMRFGPYRRGDKHASKREAVKIVGRDS
jgi:hypothetical protein